MMQMQSEAAEHAKFDEIRYAQVWEDADILLDALDVRPGHVCLSIASAGDNALALLTRSPARVIAVDLSAAQLACLELRVAAYRTLTHPELLELIGSRPSANANHRAALYTRCRPALAPDTRAFWDARPDAIANGIGAAGKFERYFTLFRTRVLPLVHGQSRVRDLLVSRDPNARATFYEQRWNSWRWRALFRVFFSRFVMGRFGRDPAFFRYVDGRVGDRILARTRHALTALDPADNPYVHWILTGTHGQALPCALREEHFETIKNNLDRLEWHRESLESFLAPARTGAATIDRYNLSDAFEYVSPENYHATLQAIVRASRPGARLAYWNMLVPRRRPDAMSAQLASLDDLAARLHERDRAFFYSAFVIEEVR
jgi:S-adenosylmethionine-diacylglycerol 3-amino-3-carboxypropyl transferase